MSEKENLERDLLAVLRKHHNLVAGDFVVTAYDIGDTAKTIIDEWVGYCQLAVGEPDEAA